MLVIRPQQLVTLEQDRRRQIALSVCAQMRDDTPHAICGLSAAELAYRLDTAVAKAVHHQLDKPDDVAAFVRLSLVAGPHFDEYPRFAEILSGYASEMRLLALFAIATPADWSNAAQYDIVSRYRASATQKHGIALAALCEDHAACWFRDALHPDVWRLARMTPMASVAQARASIRALAAEGHTGYAIVDGHDQFVGAIVASREHNGRRLLYWVARHAWGQGVATQALMQLKAALRGEKIMLTIDPGNAPSRRVALACGFIETAPSAFEA